MILPTGDHPYIKRDDDCFGPQRVYSNLFAIRLNIGELIHAASGDITKHIPNLAEFTNARHRTVRRLVRPITALIKQDSEEAKKASGLAIELELRYLNLPHMLRNYGFGKRGLSEAEKAYISNVYRDELFAMEAHAAILHQILFKDEIPNTRKFVKGSVLESGILK